jgi:hypothetical protein
VELLDGTSIECTLSAESTGKECLDNVGQRLGLQQVRLRLVDLYNLNTKYNDSKNIVYFLSVSEPVPLYFALCHSYNQ